jgi:protein gp37
MKPVIAMSNTTSIEWTEQTWNPTTGCTKISPGCKHCYAETMALRLQAMGMSGYENGFALSLMPDRLTQPLLRKKPTMYFVNSMSDLFHEGIPYEYLDKVFSIILATTQHTYQILTKRADRMSDYFATRKVPDNAWLGVTAEDIEFGIPRIRTLQNIHARVRFLSCEPLLEDIGIIDLSGINWVIVGGESGSKARPMREHWVLSIKNQCERHNVAFFFKQWGTWGADGIKRNKHANGRLLLGEIWSQYPISHTV